MAKLYAKWNENIIKSQNINNVMNPVEKSKSGSSSLQNFCIRSHCNDKARINFFNVINIREISNEKMCQRIN